MLSRFEVPVDVIDIFVASESERTAYRRVLGPAYHLIVGVPGIHRQREFIHDYYKAGARVLCIDDDVRGLKTLYEGVPFEVLVESMFEIADKEGCRLWGVYPTDNGLQLEDRAVKGMRYVIGSFFGMRNWKGVRYPDPTTEDFTRTIYACLADGAVLRFEGVGIQTAYFSEPGGLQTYRTDERQEAEMRRLVARYPDFVRLRVREGRMTDVQFRRGEREILNAPFTSSL